MAKEQTKEFAQDVPFFKAWLINSVDDCSTYLVCKTTRGICDEQSLINAHQSSAPTFNDGNYLYYKEADLCSTIADIYGCLNKSSQIKCDGSEHVLKSEMFGLRLKIRDIYFSSDYSLASLQERAKKRNLSFNEFVLAAINKTIYDYSQGKANTVDLTVVTNDGLTVPF